jgi:putative ABC transport system substrate-binding protein
LGRRAATYAARILRGTHAGDLPVERPSVLELVINRRTARLLGITLPQSILLRANRLIE